MCYNHAMLPIVKHIVGFGLKKLASDPQARDKAVRIAKTVADEAKNIAAEPDRARAAGKAFNRTVRKFKERG